MAFRPHAELRERVQTAVDEADEYTTTSNFLRELVEEALDRREQSAYERAELTRDIGARLEEKREVHESQERVIQRFVEKGLEADEAIVVDLPEDTRQRVETEQGEAKKELEEIVRELIVDGLERREQDTVDAIGGDDELRHLVDLAREDGEDRPDAVRRLLREGVRSGRPLGRAKNWATFGFLVLFSVMVLVTILPDRFAAWGGGAVLVTIAAVGVQLVRAAYWWLFGEGAELRAR